jgi:hypothetical protein
MKGSNQIPGHLSLTPRKGKVAKYWGIGWRQKL